MAQISDDADPRSADSAVPGTGTLAASPAIVIGTIYQSLAQSLGLIFENAVSTQAAGNELLHSATTQGAIQLYSAVDFADTDSATSKAEPAPDA